jgi:hypothetical protein
MTVGVRRAILLLPGSSLVLVGCLSLAVGASADRGECPLNYESKCRPAPSPMPVPQLIARLAVDADPTGNAATSIGPINDCFSAGGGATVAVDIVVESIPLLIAQRGGILGFQFELRYSEGKVRVIGVDDRQMLAANGNTLPIEITDPLPDSDGRLATLFADLGMAPPERGSGVLSRLTLERLAPGTIKLEIANPTIVDAFNNTYAIGDVQGARIVWSEHCP